LWNASCNVFFVGYQAHGTLGRRLVDGEKNLRIAGEDVAVCAKLHTLGGFSAHGDRGDLLDWASNFGKKASFFVTHGEAKSSSSLASGLREMGYDATCPMAGSVYGLAGHNAAPERIGLAPKRRERPDRDAVLGLLAEIASETESIRESLESSDEYGALLPLLESSRLILQSVKNMGNR
jgi:metallo-beta-lactamase family protein